MIPNLHAYGTHTGSAFTLTHTLRSATRTAREHHRLIDLDTARHELWTWARSLDLDLDAIAWAPGHDGTPGPGHTCAAVVADALGIPLTPALTRTTPTPSALRTRRLSVAAHAKTITAAHIDPARIGLVDNTTATGSTLAACTGRLSQHGHDVAAWIVVTDARPDA